MESKLKDICLVISDFDGVFTDNMVCVDENGIESVFCNRSDGIGISNLKKEGIEIIIVSTEINNVVRKRAEKLRIECFSAVENKKELVRRITEERNVPLDKVAYIGNDVNDLECMKTVGLAVAVNDAYPEIIEIADIILKKTGGHGAVREFCDMYILSKNEEC